MFRPDRAIFRYVLDFYTIAIFFATLPTLVSIHTLGVQVCVFFLFVLSLSFRKYIKLLYCDEYAVGNVVCVDDRCYGNELTVNNGNACLQPLPCNATIEATSVFFGVRSGNDVIQQ
jgi:hypothetical protein